VGALSADDVVVSTMAVTTQSTGASLLWKGANSNFGGLTGEGVGVAVLDSGVAPHPDIINRLALTLDFTSDEGVTNDGYGHGTHVAGIIAGSGAGSRSDAGSSYVGMAPGATIVSLRVLGDDGTGYVSDVIEGIDWAIANKDRYKLRVLNVSLGHAATSAYADDPLAQAVERAVAAGLVVVSSAGNLGKTEDGTPVIGAVVSPGYTPGALTVGALNTHGTVARSDDGVATYSSRGPVGDPDDSATWEIKPDIVAPGNAIVSAGAPGSYLWNTFPERRVEGSNGGTYLTLSGSSMATAVVSGAVAQLLQLEPKLTPAEVKFALQFTAQRLDGFGIVEQGAGSLNVPLAAALVASRGERFAPESVEIGGEMVEAGKIAFSSTPTWTASNPKGNGDAVVWGNTIIWGNRIPVGNSTIWGTTIIWGNRGNGGVGGDTIIWGNRGNGGGVGGNTIIWGNRGAGAWADSLVWGSTIIWGNRAGASTIIWGNRGGGDVEGNTIIWGNRGNGGVSGDTIIWGNRGNGGVGGDTIIWGNRGNGGVGGDTIIWGNRGNGGVGGNTIIWGNRGNGGVGGNTIIWGNRGNGGVGGDTIIWGNRGNGGVGGDTIIWGNRGNGGVGGDTIIWGNRGNGGVSGDTIIWGNRGNGGVSGDTIIWGNRGNGTQADNSVVWGDTIIWGNRGGGLGADTIIWGNRSGSSGAVVDANTIIWGNRGGSGSDAPVWGNTIIWGNRGSASGDTIIWGNH
jgi:serine protease AprX